MNEKFILRLAWSAKFILQLAWSAKFILQLAWSAKFILQLDFLDITVFLASSYGIGAFPKKVISINRAFAK
ncbi:MAG: hypothetical protein DRR16_23010 [Candidatus Parabeggiatoa sp. nov. 3]|nr:MAG: hypothetical protein DRR16_23010 [Gammaproteobacteria bacterium]